jgi:iron complex outermembrane receptor protein
MAQPGPDTVRYKLNPVTVTATRISQNWLDIPMAATVLSVNSTLIGKGYGLDALLSTVPGVLAQSRYGNQDIRLTIRGYGARGAGERSNAGTTRGIRVLIDGFPETEPDGRTSFDLVDLSGAGSVEIIRSNASSIWGNAAGGVVNVQSNTSFDEPYADVRSVFGSFGFHKEAFRLGTMLDVGRLFFSLSNTTSGGWRVHSASSQTLLNTGVVSRLGERTSLGVYLTGTSNLFRVPGPLSQAQFDSLPQQADISFITRDDRRNNRLGRIGVTLAHGLDGDNAITVSGFTNTKYLQRSERNRYRDFNRFHLGGSLLYQNTASLSHQLNNVLAIGGDEAYQDGSIHFYSLTPSGDRGTTLVANKREGANNAGAYVQDELKIGRDVSLLAGLRYDNITYYYDDYISPGLNDAKSFEHVTPKAGVTYHVSHTQSVYLSLGGGVEVPAGNEVDPVPTFGTDTVRTLNPLLEPITSTTVELGTKQVITWEGSGVLTYDIALYRLEVQNDIIPYDGGVFYYTAGLTRRMGVEAGARLALDNGLSFDAALTASDNTYRDYTIDSVHYGDSGKFASLSGNKAAGVPDFFYTLGIRYARPGGLFAEAQLHGVGSYFADDWNLYSVPSYGVLNAAIGVDHCRMGGWYVSAMFGINNITDQTFAASAWINPTLNAGGKPVFLEPGLPRNVVGSFSLGLEF